jgi:hypothetical protein
VGGLVLPETSPALLAQRTPGEADLRIVTAGVVPAGRHQVDPRRPGLRVACDRRVTLRASLPTIGRVDLLTDSQASR